MGVCDGLDPAAQDLEGARGPQVHLVVAAGCLERLRKGPQLVPRPVRGSDVLLPRELQHPVGGIAAKLLHVLAGVETRQWPLQGEVRVLMYAALRANLSPRLVPNTLIIVGNLERPHVFAIVSTGPARRRRRSGGVT